MAVMQISCVGCAVLSFNVRYEILGASGFSKYHTFWVKFLCIGKQADRFWGRSVWY